MKVKDEVQISKNHSIEWGESTWDANNYSIRNRFDTATGKFNQAGSSEIPW